jgi:biopolymer transport protein ExbD
VAGQSNQADDELITQINVTPLVDIILVLLIVFMVTAEVIHQEDKEQVIPVDLPASASAQEMLNRGLMNLVIDGEGTLYLNGNRTELSRVKEAAESTLMRGLTPRALISADERISHGEVVRLMDFLRLHKVTSISINTKSQEIE